MKQDGIELVGEGRHRGLLLPAGLVLHSLELVTPKTVGLVYVLQAPLSVKVTPRTRDEGRWVGGQEPVVNDSSSRTSGNRPPPSLRPLSFGVGRTVS